MAGGEFQLPTSGNPRGGVMFTDEAPARKTSEDKEAPAHNTNIKSKKNRNRVTEVRKFDFMIMFLLAIKLIKLLFFLT